MNAMNERVPSTTTGRALRYAVRQTYGPHSIATGITETHYARRGWRATPFPVINDPRRDRGTNCWDALGAFLDASAATGGDEWNVQVHVMGDATEHHADFALSGILASFLRRPTGSTA